MDTNNVPDIFADGANLAGGPYGYTLTLHRSIPGLPADDHESTIVARVRLSPLLTKALAQMLTSATTQAEPEPAPAEG
jgi:hypothetical protein